MKEGDTVKYECTIEDCRSIHESPDYGEIIYVSKDGLTCIVRWESDGALTTEPSVPSEVSERYTLELVEENT